MKKLVLAIVSIMTISSVALAEGTRNLKLSQSGAASTITVAKVKTDVASDTAKAKVNFETLEKDATSKKTAKRKLMASTSGAASVIVVGEKQK